MKKALTIILALLLVLCFSATASASIGHGSYKTYTTNKKCPVCQQYTSNWKGGCTDHVKRYTAAEQCNISNVCQFRYVYTYGCIIMYHTNGSCHTDTYTEVKHATSHDYTSHDSIVCPFQ